MSSHTKKPLRPKKLSVHETHFSFKTSQSPDASTSRKFHQSKPNIFQFPDQVIPFTTKAASPKTFSLILNGNTIRLDQLKSPKSLKIASYRVPATNKSPKSPGTLNEISPSPSPSFREVLNRRVPKSHSTAVPGGQEFLCPPVNLDVKGSSQTSINGHSDLMYMVNAKSEELEYLQRNVNDLQTRVNSLTSARLEYENEMEGHEEIRRELEKKDQMIEIYRKLLVMFSKGKKPVSTSKARTLESPKKQKVTSKGVRIDTSIKNSSTFDSQPLSGSFSTLMYKNSPYGEKNDSRWYSKITEQESNVNGSKEDILSISPSYRINTKDSSGHVQKEGRLDFKMKVLKSIYGAETRSARKSGLSGLLSASQEATGDMKKLNRTLSQERELNSTWSLHEVIKKPKNPEDGITKQLAGFMGKLDNFFRKYEKERERLIKKNEEVMEKIEMLRRKEMKTQETD